MPLEHFEEEGLAKIPNLELAQIKFLLTTDKHKNDPKLKKQLFDAIKSDNMAPFYENVCQDLGWPLDQNVLQQMKDKNKQRVKEIDAKIEDAEKNLGDTEVRDFMLEKGELFTRIGAKEEAVTQFRKTNEKTVTTGYKLDMIFHQLRLGLFYMDHDLIKRNLEKAQSLVEEGGDWDRRNRLKVYRGLYCMSIRDFKTAANMFLDTVATFTSYELMDYKTFISYTVIVSMIALNRPDLRSKVVKGSEILEVLHSETDIRQYLFSLYNGNYAEFFKSLAAVEQKLKYDRFLAPHYRFYAREMRILAYSQQLESYSSLTLEKMAQAFGVTPAFIDRELSRFISAGRLHAKIDKVGGIVETNRPDSKNYQYQQAIKKGDVLLNRVQKLSRVINI